MGMIQINCDILVAEKSMLTKQQLQKFRNWLVIFRIFSKKIMTIIINDNKK